MKLKQLIIFASITLIQMGARADFNNREVYYEQDTLTVEMYGESFYGFSNIPLKDKLQNKYPYLYMGDIELNSLRVFAKSQYSNGLMTLIVGGDSSPSQNVYGSSTDFYSNEKYTYDSLSFANPSRYSSSQGPWQLQLQGNVRVDEIVFYVTIKKYIDHSGDNWRRPLPPPPPRHGDNGGWRKPEPPPRHGGDNGGWRKPEPPPRHGGDNGGWRKPEPPPRHGGDNGGWRKPEPPPRHGGDNGGWRKPEPPRQPTPPRSPEPPRKPAPPSKPTPPSNPGHGGNNHDNGGAHNGGQNGGGRGGDHNGGSGRGGQNGDGNGDRRGSGRH